MKPKETLARFDAFLAKHGLPFEAIAVGGAALGLLDVISRETRDCDILHPELSKEIRDAAAEFAAHHEELKLVTPWVEAQDANIDRPAHVRATFEDLQRRLGRGV